MATPVPYVLIVGILELCAFTYASPSATLNIRRNSSAIAVLFFFFFFAFRGFIFSDWITYYDFFQKCDWSDLFGYKLGSVVQMEPGFVLLNLICKFIIKDYFFLQFVICLIDTVLLLRFFRGRIDNLPLALLLYFVFGGLTMSINLMRNSIAAMLFLNAIDFLRDRRPIPYFAICLLALSFHSSSVLFFPLYFFLNRRFNKWIFLAVFVVCNIVFLFHIPVVVSLLGMLGIDEQFSDKVKAYTEVMDKSSVLSIGYLERLFTFALAFYFYDKILAMKKENAIFMNSLLIYFIFTFFFSQFQVMSERLGTLFIFSYWIMWAYYIKCFERVNNKNLFIYFIAFYSLVKTWSMTQLPSMEYDNLLFGIKSYQERLFIFFSTFDDL